MSCLQVAWTWTFFCWGGQQHINSNWSVHKVDGASVNSCLVFQVSLVLSCMWKVVAVPQQFQYCLLRGSWGPKAVPAPLHIVMVRKFLTVTTSNCMDYLKPEREYVTGYMFKIFRKPSFEYVLSNGYIFPGVILWFWNSHYCPHEFLPKFPYAVG